jgi:hypothetical protein
MTEPISYLFLTTDKNRNQCIHIKNHKAHECWHRFKDDLYQGDTLMCGYLLDDFFLISDIIIYDRKVQRQVTHERISLCNKLIDYSYIYDPILGSGKVSVMEHTEYGHMVDFWRHRKSLPYQGIIDGLLFRSDRSTLVMRDISDTDEVRPLDSPSVAAGTKVSSKVEEGKRLCFLVRSTDVSDVYDLYLAAADGSLVRYDTAGVQGKETSVMLREQIRTGRDQCMICEYRTTFKRWIPIRCSKQKIPDSIHCAKP